MRAFSHLRSPLMICCLIPLFFIQCKPKVRQNAQCKSLPKLEQDAWVRVLLDRECQVALPNLEILNRDKQPRPFLMESRNLWPDIELSFEKPNLGMDGRGDPTVELTLQYPSGIQRRNREHLRFQLDLEGMSPWLCHVDIHRRNAGGQPITLQTEEALQIYDFGEGVQHLDVIVPWDHDIYRLTLRNRQGALPRFKNFKVTAFTDPLYRREESRVKAKLVKNHEGYSLELPQKEPVAGAILHLAAGSQITLPILTPEGQTSLPIEKRIWNLPKQDTRSAQLRWPVIQTRRMQLKLSPKATLEQVELIIHRPILIFHAKANEEYHLRLDANLPKDSQKTASKFNLPNNSHECHQLAAIKPGPSQACP